MRGSTAQQSKQDQLPLRMDRGTDLCVVSVAAWVRGADRRGLVHDVGRTCKRIMAARRRLPECLLLSPPRRQVPLQLDQGVMRTSPGGRQKDVKSSPAVADASVLPPDIRVAQTPGRRQGPLSAISNALPTSLAAARSARPQLAGG
jgi:hypothetical protein